jgi:hypothetical protein
MHNSLYVLNGILLVLQIVLPQKKVSFTSFSDYREDENLRNAIVTVPEPNTINYIVIFVTFVLVFILFILELLEIKV